MTETTPSVPPDDQVTPSVQSDDAPAPSGPKPIRLSESQIIAVLIVVGILVFIFGCILLGNSSNQSNGGVLGLVGLLLMGFGALSMVIGGVMANRRSGGQPATSLESATPFSATPLAEMSIENRNAILQQQIYRYVTNGFRVVSQTQTTAQLIKPKQFSCIIATLGLLLLVIGLIIYIFIYMASKDEQVYLEVDPYGRVLRR